MSSDAIAGPANRPTLPCLKTLRQQARESVSGFIQEVLDHPANRNWLRGQTDFKRCAHDLWHEGLLTAYRLLFLLKLQADHGAGNSLRLAQTRLWRELLWPDSTLAQRIRSILNAPAPSQAAPRGESLEARLRWLFRFVAGTCAGTEPCDDAAATPLGGSLFAEEATPTLNQLAWGDRAVACLLDRFLWQAPGQKRQANRKPLDYASLDIEDLGHVYEALLELEPGIADQTMCRLRRQKLEVVVPQAQGEPYRGATAGVRWIEAIPAGRFYLRASLGRKTAGAYYTPHALVRFLVEETLGPQVKECSPSDDPHPAAILKLKVLDPAMGSGHFLVEACRFLGRRLYEACRHCTALALAAEHQASQASGAVADLLHQQAQRWRGRIGELPDFAQCLLHDLASAHVPGAATDDAQRRAMAICRRLVAEHCLYGVDKNPLAVELARIALWLQSYVEGFPLVTLDHHLVRGDALTGPLADQLPKPPGTPPSSSPPDCQPLRSALQQALRDALQTRPHDRATLWPFRVLAAAWSGGAMLGPQRCDQAAYAELVNHIAAHRQLPRRIESPSLRQMIARGLGVPSIPADRERLYEVIASGPAEAALPFDQAFPEVFYPDGDPEHPQGFHAILGNPPWEAVRPKRGEFFGTLDFQALAGYTKREREGAEARLLRDPEIATQYETYIDAIEGLKRAADELYAYQKLTIDGELAGRYLDLYRIFMERSAMLVRPTGRVGLIVPAAFRANAGAAGIRRLYMLENRLECCYTFRNTRQLFDISPGLQFCVVVATFGRGPTRQVRVAFDLDDDGWLVATERRPEVLVYPLELIRATGGPYLTMVNLPGREDVRLMLHLAEHSQPLRNHPFFQSIQFQTNPAALNATKDSWRLEETHRVCHGDPRDPAEQQRLWAAGYVPLHEKGTFSRYCWREREQPRYLVDLKKCTDRPDLLRQSQYYRLVGRSAIHASEPDKSVFALIPPGGLVSNSAMVEASPERRPNAHALAALAILNSHVFNYLASQQVVLNLNLFILRNIYIPQEWAAVTFLAHGALRLMASDEAFAPLWHEQLDGLWRESAQTPFSWPALADDESRSGVRATIDAVVAMAYGLSREQYAHVLSSLNHAAWPNATRQCLACFDALQAAGLKHFAAMHDPYYDVPLNTNPPSNLSQATNPSPTYERKTGDCIPR